MAKVRDHNPDPYPTDGVPLSVVPRLLRREAAAAYLAISVSTLDALRSRGYLREVRPPSTRHHDERGRTPLFDRIDLDRLVDSWKET